MKSKALRSYLIYTAVLLILALAAILYVRSLLIRYEDSQPEREVERQIELLRDAAANGTLAELISLDDFKPESEETYKAEVEALTEKLKTGTITYEDRYAASGHAYDIKCGSETLARITLESVESERETKLIVFNFEKWQVEEIVPAVISGEIEMSSSLTLTINDEVVEGEASASAGYTKYNFSRITTPEIIVSDLAGGTAVYDPTKNIMTYGYKVMMPSNYTLTANGKVIDPAVAISEASDDYKDIVQWCSSVPTDLTYDLVFLRNDVELGVTDASGAAVDFEIVNRTIKVENQPTGAPVAEDIMALFDPLEIAEMWSLFMTNDLEGGNNGYNKLKYWIVEDSYLDEVAWKWANGIDITFTSVHTLGNPPFIGEEVTDYVRYADNCFSCTIRFEKIMHLNSGDTVNDVMDSTFYFVNIAEAGEEPDWRIASIRANVSEGGEDVE